MNSILKAIGRMFTVPAATRKQLDSNVAVQAVKAAVLPAVITDVAASIDKNVSDPTAAALIKAELGHLLQSSGIAN